jgi:hypothetical protein
MLRRTLLAAPLAAAALAACTTPAPGTQPAGVRVSPLPLLIGPVEASLAPWESGAGARCGPSSPRPSRPPGAASGPFFRDEFDGDQIDTDRWIVQDNDGLVVAQDGRLLMVGTGSRNFPRLLSRIEVFPPRGARFLEVGYEMLTDGWYPGFNLDHLPPERPGERPEKAFVSTRPFYSGLMVVIPSTGVTLPGPVNTGVVGKPHRFRIEVKEDESYRFIVDNDEVGTTAASQRPPRNFWIGNELFPTGEPMVWAKLAIDYIETGEMTAPAATNAKPVEPQATATAPVAASDSPSPAAPPSPSPEPPPVPAPGTSPAAGPPSPVEVP